MIHFIFMQSRIRRRIMTIDYGYSLVTVGEFAHEVFIDLYASWLHITCLDHKALFRWNSLLRLLIRSVRVHDFPNVLKTCIYFKRPHRAFRSSLDGEHRFGIRPHQMIDGWNIKVN